jgi:hypothetical protein
MGKAVQYQLMLVKFQASMDPGTGNFLINLNFQSYKFNVLTDIQWGYVQAVPNMYSLSLRNIYDINLFKQELIKNRLSFFGTVTNILKEEFTENVGYATRGRNFRVGLNITL